jgi:hypothetical protein
MRVSAFLVAILCAGAAHAEVVILSSELQPESTWSVMNEHTFAPDHSEFMDACGVLAATSQDDPLELAHCQTFYERLIGTAAPVDCMSTVVSQQLPDGSRRVLDLLAERRDGNIVAKERAEMKLPLAGYPATVCSLGESRGYDVVGLVFDDDKACFNPAFVFVPLPKIGSATQAIPVINHPARHQGHDRQVRRGFPYHLDCVPRAVNQYLRNRR